MLLCYNVNGFDGFHLQKHSNLPWKCRNENLFPVKHQRTIDVCSSRFNTFEWTFYFHSEDLELLLGGGSNFSPIVISAIWNSISHKIYICARTHNHQYGAILKRIWTLSNSNSCHCKTRNKVTKSYWSCTMQHRVRHFAPLTIAFAQSKGFTSYKFSPPHTMNNDNLLHRIIKSFNCFVVS